MKRSDGITIISIYHYFVAALFVLGACIMVAVPFIVAAVPEDTGPAVPIVAIVTVVIVCLLLLVAALFGVIGWGLWTLKPWARLGTIVLAGLSLLCVPVGTIIGGLTLWYLFQPEARAAFGEETRA